MGDGPAGDGPAGDGPGRDPDDGDGLKKLERYRFVPAGMARQEPRDAPRDAQEPEPREPQTRAEPREPGEAREPEPPGAEPPTFDQVMEQFRFTGGL